jgi:hypothetical protein
MRNAITMATSMPGITDGDLRVLVAVLELTAGHGKLTDHVIRKELAERAGVSERTATRGLKKWDDLGVIVWRPARALGQLGELTLCCAPVDKPECVPLTRDKWLSRVQPQPETDDHATRDKSARDSGQSSVSQPPYNHHLPPEDDAGQSFVSGSGWVRSRLGKLPHCEHGFVFSESGYCACDHGCVRNEHDAFTESESRELLEPDFPASAVFS